MFIPEYDKKFFNMRGKPDFRPIEEKINELNKLFEKSKDDSMEFMILMTAFYGLRRSEVLSLKWDAFDFENNTINLIEFEESLE